MVVRGSGSAWLHWFHLLVVDVRLHCDYGCGWGCFHVGTFYCGRWRVCIRACLFGGVCDCCSAGSCHAPVHRAVVVVYGAQLGGVILWHCVLTCDVALYLVLYVLNACLTSGAAGCGTSGTYGGSWLCTLHVVFRSFVLLVITQFVVGVVVLVLYITSCKVVVWHGGMWCKW